MSRLVGKECIDFAAAQAGLVNAQIRTNVFREQQVVTGMSQLVPCAEIAEMLLVLGREVLAVHSVVAGNPLYALCRGLNPPLLKKPQTQG